MHQYGGIEEVLLNKYRKCDKCGIIYNTNAFANMLGNGELAYSQIEIYGDKYDLCPGCTREIYKLLHPKQNTKR